MRVNEKKNEKKIKYIKKNRMEEKIHTQNWEKEMKNPWKKRKFLYIIVTTNKQTKNENKLYYIFTYVLITLSVSKAKEAYIV